MDRGKFENVQAVEKKKQSKNGQMYVAWHNNSHLFPRATMASNMNKMERDFFGVKKCQRLKRKNSK